MIVIDARKKRKFWEDVQKIKKLNMKSYTNYNRQYCTKSVVLSIIFIVLTNLLKLLLYDLCFTNRHTAALSTVYFVIHVLSLLSIVTLAFIVIELNYRPYLFRRLKFSRVCRDLIKSASYGEMLLILDKLGCDDLSICTERSRTWLNNFKVYCSIECFANDYVGCEVLSAVRNVENTKLRLRGVDGDHRRFQIDLPYAGKFAGTASAIMLTSSGVVLSEAV